MEDSLVEWETGHQRMVKNVPVTPQVEETPAPGDIGCNSQWHCCYSEYEVGQGQTKDWNAGWTAQNGMHLVEDLSLPAL